MLEFAEKTFEFAGGTYNYAQLGVAAGVVTSAFVIGAILPTVLRKVVDVAKRVFAAIKDYFSKVPFFVRVKSMFCDDCAMRHREHVVRRREAIRRDELRIIQPNEPIIQQRQPIVPQNENGPADHENGRILRPVQLPDIGVDA